MKKILILSMVCIVLFSMIFNVYAEENGLINILNSIEEKFKDITTHWANELISKLIAIGAINGYPDGNFRPDNNIKVGEFAKILVSSLGYDDLGNFEGGHWSLNYVNKAKELGLIKEGEFEISDLDRNINRGEMARMIVRSVQEEYPANLNEYSNQIVDYNEIPENYREHVLKAFVKGIITGYTDGTFVYGRNATRAEASTMIVRMLDKDERKEPKIQVEIDNEEKEIIINGEVITNENPENVIPVAIKAREIMKKGKGLFAEQFNGIGSIIYWYYDNPNVDIEDSDERYTMDMSFKVYTELRSEEGANYPYLINLKDIDMSEESHHFTKEILKELFPQNYDDAYRIIVEAMENKESNDTFELIDKKYHLDDRILRLYTIQGMKGLTISASVKNLKY